MSTDKNPIDPAALGHAHPLLIPCFLKWTLVILSALIIIAAILFTGLFIHNPARWPSPSDLSMPALLIFATSLLLVLFLPWEKFGLQLTKVGWFEFNTVTTNQANERVREIAELEERLLQIESNPTLNRDESGFLNSLQEPELKKKLLSFLKEQYPTAYSPTRIIHWGGRLPGYEIFQTVEAKFVRATLRQLVQSGELTTAISQQGNTLYKVKARDL